MSAKSSLVALSAAMLLTGSLLASTAGAGDTVTRTVSTQRVIVEPPRPPRGIDAKTAIVVDDQTGVKLWGRGTRNRRLIASTTKIMTALVAISRTRPNEMLTATNYRAGVGESLLGLAPGERMSAQDMIRGLLMESGNDAADTLAARTASSRAAFVGAMNRRARAMGLTRTRFANPVGLDSANNYSTASDLAQLARKALTVPRFASVVDKQRATLRSGDRVHRIGNRNPLIGRYPWAIGVKTGHTMAAGYLLVGAAKKNDAKLISVVTGEPTELARVSDSAELLRFGRAHYRPLTPLRTNRLVAALPIKYEDGSVALLPTRSAAIAARNGQQVAVTITTPKEIRGPRSAGSVVGRAVVLRDGSPVATVPLKLAKAVPEPTTAAVMMHTLGRLIPLLLLLVFLCLIVVFLRSRGERRTRRPEFVG